MSASVSPYRRAAGAAAAAVLGLPVLGAAYLRLKYGPRLTDDIAELYASYLVLKRLKYMEKNHIFMIDVFESRVKETPDKTFLLYQDEKYTFSDLDKEGNRLARFMQSDGRLLCKDSAAILMLNDPGFLVTWLACSKLGLKTAFLNYNLKSSALLHCIKACTVRAVLVGKGKM